MALQSPHPDGQGDRARHRARVQGIQYSSVPACRSPLSPLRASGAQFGPIGYTYDIKRLFWQQKMLTRPGSLVGLTHKGACGGERGHSARPAAVDLWREADVSRINLEGAAL